MEFLPKTYKEPVTDKYMKFADGENVFRILSPAVYGYEYWKNVDIEGQIKRTPIRKTLEEKIDINDLETDKNGDMVMPKVFWAFVVYNFNTETIQILEVTQATIRRAIKALTDNKKWGDPTTYNICVTKSGQKLETEYQTNPEPKEELDKKILEQYQKMTIDLKRLFSGEDPFGKDEKLEKENKEEINVNDIPF